MFEFPVVGRLAVEFYVSPRTGVAAGDILTLTLILENASHRPMDGLAVAAPVPRSTTPVEGWLYQDAVRAGEGAFFGEGTELAALAPGARTAFMWKLRVEEGGEAIRIVPQIWGAVTPIVGAEPVEVARVAANYHS